jgi:hypothetical protein
VSANFLRNPAQYAKRAEKIAQGELKSVWVLHLSCRRLTRNWTKERVNEATSSSESFFEPSLGASPGPSALASPILSARTASLWL